MAVLQEMPNFAAEMLIAVYMLREVLRRCDAEYVHLISGQDYPMKPLGEFLLFFEQHRDKDCMQYF